MKKLLFFSLMFVWNITGIVAGTLLKVLATDTTTPTPQNCSKVVFAQSTACSKIPSMTIEDKNGDQFVLESRGFGVPPYMYFIPDGEYTVVGMTNMKSCNTAYGTLVVGSKFSGKEVGYMTFSAIEEPEKLYSFDRELSTESIPMQVPEGTSKIIFAFGANKSMIIQDSNGRKWQLEGHVPPYFYFMRYGTYKVIQMNGFSKCDTAKGALKEGDTFVINEQNSIGYFS